MSNVVKCQQHFKIFLKKVWDYKWYTIKTTAKKSDGRLTPVKYFLILLRSKSSKIHIPYINWEYKITKKIYVTDNASSDAQIVTMYFASRGISAIQLGHRKLKVDNFLKYSTLTKFIQLRTKQGRSFLRSCSVSLH